MTERENHRSHLSHSGPNARQGQNASAQEVNSVRYARATTNRRLRAIIAIILVMAVLLAGRLVFLQVLQADKLSSLAREFRTRSYTQEALRGDILDSNGDVLATSVPRYNVRVDQVAIKDFKQYNDDGEVIGTGAAAAAALLAPILKEDQATLGGRLLGGEKKSHWGLIKSGLTPDEWRKINDLNIHGIFPERYMQREYPNGTVAGTILGYVGQTEDDPHPQGRAGIEQSLNDVLKGVDGKLTVEVGPDGTIFPQGEISDTPAVDGRKIKLTINRDMQKVAQDAVDKSVGRFGAKWGSAVVIEIGTGRVLALADSASPNPGKLNEADPKNWGSRSVSSVVEPGSTGKIVTYSAAINEGKINPLSVFTVPSQYKTSTGEVINDVEQHATVRMTAAGIIALSYNTGLVQIGQLIEDKKRFEYMKAFGLGSKTGIELPAEEPGLLNDYTKWDRRSKFTTMFGQAYAVTPIQLAQVGSIVGSKGVKNPIHIVDGTYDEKGNYKPTVVDKAQQVISPETSDTILKMMQGVTQKGSTGQLAAVPGYNVAGKTGTAQVINSAGKTTALVGTFTGLIPAENPKIAVAVVVYTGHEPGFGGVIAAPVFADIGEFAMRQMKVPPSSVPLYKYPWYENELGK
ncbi:peptidoglycan D,D-transpeptidase FtsI family protein [Arcanobacterium ihumii]|uniref:peptidoglycan D,D-transpeptidase FtsI family protein n=1 Tax=Arcanobacterium ihumii TaxID=2138162 RepID=UPI000F533E09|nr:penicillin-binding protein 2 [Arcanobacterium ihumii]